jgi:glyoxylase-like metal-dependent hydrolase (beta-lactamase superfamily II)
MTHGNRGEEATFTRRELLRIAGVAGVAAALPWRAEAGAGPALPSLKGPQAGGHYRFAVGGIEAISIGDGGFDMKPIQPTWAPEARKEELEATLRSAFLPTDRLELGANVLLLKSGGELILADTGAGALFGPSLGGMRERMEAAGVRPGQITRVVLSHLHGDHIGGLLDGEGTPVFPNAKVCVSKAEIDFWSAPPPGFLKARVAKEVLEQAFAVARRHLAAARDHLVPVVPGERIAEGVDIVDAAGHTPGHIALLAASGGEALLNIADTAHHFVLGTAHPEWSCAFDVDPERAKRVRRAILERAASGRLRLLGYHFPFPGIGHVRTAGNGAFEWVPEPWSWNATGG